MNRRHAPFMVFVFASLLFGMWAGLVRSGWQLPQLHDDFALAHGVLMIGGFMGTLINLERAVALNAFLRTPRLRLLPYLAPLFSVTGALALIINLSFAALLLTLSSLGMVLMFAYIVHKHPAVYTLTMATGAICWFMGNLIWLGGEPLFMSVPWWMAFLILTIAGERLELARLMRHSRRSIHLFAIAAALWVTGLLMTRSDYDLGVRCIGVGDLGIAFWLLRYDVIRRTIRQRGLPRFIAVCLAAGYFWLIISGLMALYYGGVKAGMRYDALLHSVFLGFAFSMIFGHAPIILPSVLRINIRYSSLFYVPLTLLHLSLLLRVGGDLSAWQDGRQWGAMLNVLVLLLFIGNMVRSLHTDSGQPLLPRSKFAMAGYGLIVTGFLSGIVLVSTDLDEKLNGDATGSNSITQGERLYQTNCSACHGVDLQGINGLGKNLLESDFVASQNDAELHRFIVQGRPIWDIANTTGIEMPPRGGNPSLKDSEIDAIIDFIRAKSTP